MQTRITLQILAALSFLQFWSLLNCCVVLLRAFPAVTPVKKKEVITVSERSTNILETELKNSKDNLKSPVHRPVKLTLTIL